MRHCSYLLYCMVVRQWYGGISKGSRIVGSPKRVWRNDEIIAAVRRKEAARKGVLAASDEETKESCMEAYREDKKKVKCV